MGHHLLYSHELFASDIKKLTKELQDSTCLPQAILGIARGGLFTATALSYSLSCRQIFTIQAISYNSTMEQNKLEVLNVPDLSSVSNILIVDDVADSGITFQSVLGLLKERYPNLSCKTLSLFYKPKSTFRPDFFARETEEWIDFFHEIDYSNP